MMRQEDEKYEKEEEKVEQEDLKEDQVKMNKTGRRDLKSKWRWKEEQDREKIIN